MIKTGHDGQKVVLFAQNFVWVYFLNFPQHLRRKCEIVIPAAQQRSELHQLPGDGSAVNAVMVVLSIAKQ